MEKYVLGCDIGNGFGYVSFLEKENGEPITLFPSKYPQLTAVGMPTTVYAEPPSGERLEVFSDGKSAERRHAREPEHLIHAVKTRLKEQQIEIPGISAPVSVFSMYSAVARDLILLANEELKNRGNDEAYEMVFAFPADVADDLSTLNQMQAAIESVKIEGQSVKVLGRLPEPAAVAIDYLYYMQHHAPEHIRITKDTFTVLVYDLGHGTFDTAVVTARSKGDPYQLHFKAGIPDAAGKDFDELLYREFCGILREKYGYEPKNELAREKIRKAAVDAKHELSQTEESLQNIEIDGDYKDIEITRERFETLSQNLIFKTLETVQAMLDEAEAGGIAIDAIVLSGGASRMPMVKHNLEALVEGTLPIVLYRPSEAVSFGTARYAYAIQAKEKNDKTNKNKTTETENKTSNSVLAQAADHCYGIWVPTQTLSGEVRFLIKSGDGLPVMSEWVEYEPMSSHFSVPIYRSHVKNKPMDTAQTECCESMLYFPFDIAMGEKCMLRLTLLEDYNIILEMKTKSGKILKKSSADRVSELVK